jgi:predicted nucleotidyltransferase
MKYGLSENTILKITHILEQFPVVEKAIIYGSRAKGNFKQSSDIDITLKGSNIDLQLLSRIILKLDDLLLPYKFDLSIYNHIANRELLDHINRVGQTFYETENLTIF